jgi:hypothetical protein
VKNSIWPVKSNAVGLDRIPLNFIKLILPEIISSIAHIFSKRISFKVKGERSKYRLKNYRSITILPALSKALEKIIISTITALLKITDNKAIDMDKNPMPIPILLDFTKAFDTVIIKLEKKMLIF